MSKRLKSVFNAECSWFKNLWNTSHANAVYPLESQKHGNLSLIQYKHFMEAEKSLHDWRGYFSIKHKYNQPCIMKVRGFW